MSTPADPDRAFADLVHQYTELALREDFCRAEIAHQKATLVSLESFERIGDNEGTLSAVLPLLSTYVSDMRAIRDVMHPAFASGLSSPEWQKTVTELLMQRCADRRRCMEAQYNELDRCLHEVDRVRGVVDRLDLSECASGGETKGMREQLRLLLGEIAMMRGERHVSLLRRVDRLANQRPE